MPRKILSVDIFIGVLAYCLIGRLLFVDRTSYDTAFGSLDKVEYQVSFFAGFVFGFDSLDGFRIIQATGI